MVGSVFINDSFTFKGRIDATPGLHPAVRFAYRPGGMAARIAVESAAGTKGQLEAEAKVMLANLREFTIEHDRGDAEVIVLTQQQAETLHPDIFRGILNRILGYVGPSMESEGNGSSGASG